MSNILEGGHHCWSKKCEKCGSINVGCVKFKVFCYNCKEPLILFEIYEKTDSKDLFISPEAIKELTEWGKESCVTK